MTRDSPGLRALPVLQANGPYDFQRSFSRIVCAVVAKRHPAMGSRSQLLGEGEFALPLCLHGKPLLIGLRAASANGVAPRVVAGGYQVDRKALLAELRRILCLDHDLEAFYRTVEDDRPLLRLTQRYRGLRLTLTPTVFQGLVHAILFQQISYAAAQTVEDRLVARWGGDMLHGDRRFPLFPGPETLASQSVESLRSVGIPPRKAQAILDVARKTVSGQLYLEGFGKEGDAEFVARRLQAIKGIGPWTAHHVIIRGMGLIDCLPSEDPGLRKAVGELYGWETVSAPQLVRIAEPWRPWRSYAAYYLWNTFWEGPGPANP